MKINIIIADDHKLIRQNLSSILREYNIFTIAEAENGVQLLEKLKKKTPDVILLDIQMPEMDGCDAFEKIIALYPKTKVIFLSTHNDEMLIEHLYSRGAYSFLSKNADIELVVKTIREVHKNNIVLNYPIRTKKNIETEKTKFSKRESEVSSLICEGKSNKEIANELSITNKTVEAHKKKLFEKTKTQSAVSFVSYVLKKGLNYLR